MQLLLGGARDSSQPGYYSCHGQLVQPERQHLTFSHSYMIVFTAAEFLKPPCRCSQSVLSLECNIRLPPGNSQQPKVLTAESFLIHVANCCQLR
jgi:hypothetical protein